jgi:predicted nucleic acid-binding protein
MAVAVFDADVLIAYLGRDDANHREAVTRVRRALEPGMSRLVSAVNYSEVLIGPLRAQGSAGAATVDAMLGGLGIETVHVDRALARRASAVRVRTGLKLPDACAIATAIAAQEQRGRDVRLESFDLKVARAYAALDPLPPRDEREAEVGVHNRTAAVACARRLPRTTTA